MSNESNTVTIESVDYQGNNFFEKFYFWDKIYISLNQSFTIKLGLSFFPALT